MMGFESVENVGLAAKEGAQEILKIFNQGARANKGSFTPSLPSTPAPQHPNAYHNWLDWVRLVVPAYLISRQGYT